MGGASSTKKLQILPVNKSSKTDIKSQLAQPAVKEQKSIQYKQQQPLNQQLIQQLLQCCVDGNLEMVQKICNEKAITYIHKLTGLNSEVNILSQSTSTYSWNPLHLAIYNKRLEIVKFYMEQIKVNPRLGLLGPVQLMQDDEKTQAIGHSEIPMPSISALCFSLVLAIHNRDILMLNYLLNDYSYDNQIIAYPLWNSECLSYILKGVIAEQWQEGIDAVLKGNLAYHLYSGMDYFQKLDFIGQTIGMHMAKLNSSFAEESKIKGQILNIMADDPYAGVSISFIVQDKNATVMLLEKCLNNISISDVEMIYNYELDSLPSLIRSLRQLNVDRELVKNVFNDQNKALRDKKQIKLHFFELIDYCISGNLQEAKFYIRKNEPKSINNYYGLKKLLKLPFRQEPANTKYFSPLLLAIFYNKGEFIDLFVKEGLVNGFSSLKEPPSTTDDDEATDQELGISDDHWFFSAEQEVFALQILVGQQNYDLIDSTLFKSFMHIWHFSHFYYAIEQSLHKSDQQSVDFLINHSLVKDCFEILSFDDQFKVLLYFSTKIFEMIVNTQAQGDARNQLAIQTASTFIEGFSSRPYCVQYLFLLLSQEETINEKFGAKFYTKIYNQIVKNITDEDIDLIIKMKHDDVSEITSKEFKAENKSNKDQEKFVKRLINIESQLKDEVLDVKKLDESREHYSKVKDYNNKFVVGERDILISKNNALLIRNLLEISHGKRLSVGPNTTQQQYYRSASVKPKSLNLANRKKEMERIARENFDMVKRLHKGTANISKRQQVSDYDNHVKYKKNIQRRAVHSVMSYKRFEEQ